MLKAGRLFWAFVAACALLIGGLLVHSYLTYQALARVAAPATTRAMPANQLNTIASATTITTDHAQARALDSPRFVVADQAADFMAPGEDVYLVEAPEGALVFPRAVLAAYEVVNTSVGGRAATITYSPETGSVIGFWGTVAGLTTGFDPTPLLVNGNIELRDRATGSLWPQILGAAVNGHLTGVQLDTVPIYHTTWEQVVRVYPSALVLTGDPGMPITDRDDAVMTRAPKIADDPPPKGIDNRLPLGEDVLGVTTDSDSAAVPVHVVTVRRVVVFQAGDARFVALYDTSLGVTRVFDRRLGGTAIILDPVNGAIVDRATRSVWDARGRCIAGALRGVALKPVPSVECLWYAWAAFHPDTEVYR